MKIEKPGMFFDFPIEVYHADCCPTPSLSQSVAKILLDRSAAHAKLAHPRLTPPEANEEPEKYDSTKAIGNVAHAIMLGRGRRIAEGEFDNWKTKAAQDFKADAMAAGKIVILSKHLVRALDLVKAASYQLEAAGHPLAFRRGNGEVVIAWEEDGLWFRSLIDWVDDRFPKYYDLKTSGMSCAPHVVVDRAGEHGWDIQAAFQERGLDIIDPDNAGRREFYFIAQENEQPYALTPVRISRADLTLGHKKVELAVEFWRRSIETGLWPGYPAETVTSQPRGYSEAKFLEREILHHERKREPMLTDLSGG